MKSFILDTNIYLTYLMKGDSYFSPLVNRYFKLFKNDEVIFYIPTICFWEISKKVYLEKLRIQGLSLLDALKLANNAIDDTPNFRDLPLSRKAASLAPSFSSKLSDPFDQLIVASAIEVDLPLITKDINIIKSKLVQTIW